ncbi:MAG TPA: nucleotidyl transferase AbiEii/AbiGii toxin family protein [Acidimicrobiales bacterium]|nr:nucleotidyl transferase AbiEii/AbiGii toxin family protein [Acidimicrobiales bacterium]
MLTPLQRRIAAIIGGLPEAEQFALAGGGALIARGDVERQTRDLDFFGPAPQDVNRLMPAVEKALQDAGMNVSRIREAPGFVRLEVREHDEVTEVDLGADARILPVERGELGPILAGEELAVDKVLAVFGRAEARDFVDLSAVADRYGLEYLCERALDKDRGFDPQVFREMLDRFDRLPRDEFDVPNRGFERLVAIIEEWRGLVQDLTVERLERGEHRNRDDDHGLGL